MDNNTHCPLLSLPVELREHIYDYALYPQPAAQSFLSSNQDAVGNANGRRTYDLRNGYYISMSNAEPYRPPSLLQTCRQIRREAGSHFYKSTVFWGWYTTSPGGHRTRQWYSHWWHSLSVPNRELVHDFRLECRSHDDLIDDGKPDASWHCSSAVESLADALKAIVRLPLKDTSVPYGRRFVTIEELRNDSRPRPGRRIVIRKDLRNISRFGLGRL